MKGRRKIPDWRFHGQPVDREVAPGRVPVHLYNKDGTLWRVVDLTREVIEGVEILARRERVTWNEMFTHALACGLGQPWLSPL